MNEGHVKKRGKRVFDILLEGKPVQTDYEPLANGFGVVDVLEFDVAVEDGALDVTFTRRVGDPKLSALEIESRG